MISRLKFAVPTLLAMSILAFGNSNVVGQDGGDPGTPVTPAPTTPDTTPQGDSATVTGGDGQFDPDFNNVEIEVAEDTRNQGFVGATSANLQELGYVGATSENSGPPLAEGASFGGGVNDSVGGGGGGGGRAAGGGGQGFGAAQQLGFPVIRSNLRTRLRPSFAAPQISSRRIADSFNSSFSRLPTNANFAGQFNVTVNNRRATVTGNVNSIAERDQIIRQLRLQPGIYSINDQLQIVN